MKSNIQGLFTHITYLKEEWQNDSNKLHVGGQCAPTHTENIWTSIFPFFWDGTASSGDSCLMFWNSRVVSSSRVSWRCEHNISRFSLKNSYFRNWEQSLPNKTPRLKNCFLLPSNYLQNKGTKINTMLESKETRYMTGSYKTVLTTHISWIHCTK